ncbi:hypothetical protein AAVH_37835, partial [Aphelenchoides avenae]
YFVDRLPGDGTQVRGTKDVDYADVWAEPNLITNNCLHAAQRMVLRMGHLEELIYRAKNWGYLPEEAKRKLLPFAII